MTDPVEFVDEPTDAPPLGVVSTVLWSAASLLFVRHSSDIGVMMWQWIGPHI